MRSGRSGQRVGPGERIRYEARRHRRRVAVRLGAVVLGLVVAATSARAQAPRRGPAPGELWPACGCGAPGHMDWWGPSYCVGDPCCERHCPGLLSSVGHAILKTIDCIIPCHRCGASIDDCTCAAPAPRCHVRVPGCRFEPGCGVPARRCCPPLLPSVRFHRSCCGTVEPGCGSGPVIYEGQPELVIPPKPEPEVEGTGTVKARPTGYRRLRQPPSIDRTAPRRSARTASRPVRVKSTPVMRHHKVSKVSFEAPVAQPAGKSRDETPVINPLRPKK